MSWYSAGSVAATNGSATIIGTGTSWVRNVRVGDAFRGPDKVFYEVSEIASDTEITLATAYDGATVSGASYTITPTTSHDKELVEGINGILRKADKQSFSYATRSDLVTAQASESYIVGAVAHAGGVSYRYTGIGTAIADLPGWVPEGNVTKDHFNGDLKAALAYAQTRGVALSGTVSHSTPLAPSGSTAVTIKGASPDDAVIHRAAGSATSSQHRFGGSPFDIEGVSITAEPDLTSGLFSFVFGQSATGRLERSDIDLGVTVSGGTRNYFSSVFDLGSGSHEGYTIKDCAISKVAYLFLKNNAATGQHNRWQITGNHIHDVANIPLLFNSPGAGSLMRDIFISGNSVGSVLDASGYSHRGSFAGHVEAGRVMGNFFYGQGNEMFRMEEGARWNVFLGNVAELSGEHGFETVANNVGGAATIPEYMVYGDNILVGLPGATGYAMAFQETPAGPGIKHSIVHDVIATGGWEAALNTPASAPLTMFHHNVAEGTSYGVRAFVPSLTIDETMLTDVTTPAQAIDGGLFGRIHIRSDVNDIPVSPAKMVDVVSPSGPAGFSGITWETKRFSLATGEQLIDLFPLGYLIDANATVIFTSNNVSHRAARGLLKWDGTTLSFTSSSARGTGLVSMTTPFVNNAGKLAVRLNNSGGSAVASSMVQVELSGLMLWA